MKFQRDLAWLLIGIVACWTNDGVLALKGGDAGPRFWSPWVVAVSCCTNTLGCNGALIHGAIILTSAQCMTSSATPAIPGPFCSVMVGGVTSGFAVDEAQFGEVVGAASYQEMVRHPAFQLKPLENDVGLIRLLNPFSLTVYPPHVAIVQLPPVPGTSNFSGKDLQIDSYSYPENTYALTGRLAEIYVTELSPSTGDAFWSCSSDIKFNNSQHIYLRNDLYTDTNASTCYGDIGAPASYFNDPDQLYYVVALVSMLSDEPGGPCASKRAARQDSPNPSAPQDDDPQQSADQQQNMSNLGKGATTAGFGCTARPAGAARPSSGKDRSGRQLPGFNTNKCSDISVPQIGTRVEPYRPFITSVGATWGITI